MWGGKKSGEVRMKHYASGGFENQLQLGGGGVHGMAKGNAGLQKPKKYQVEGD